jgi:inosose dehydratase
MTPIRSRVWAKLGATILHRQWPVNPLAESPHPAERMILVAAAPVSFGAFEVTVGIDPHVPDGVAVLDAVAAAGYTGIDLGPPGYLGAESELPGRLRSRELFLAGGYHAMPFADSSAMDEAMLGLNRLLDIFDRVALDAPLAPRPTLADSGSEARRSSPGRISSDRSLMLGASAWPGFAANVARAASLCRERGYEPTFHHHGASYIESAEEIGELLRLTDVGLCLDTGHLVIGGGDPLRAVADWGGRINHVHLKDVRRSIIDRVTAARGRMIDFWREGAFCVLGEGDLDLEAILRALRDSGFQGWLVVEQDMLPRPDESTDRAARDQRRNRDYLRRRGL